MLGFADQDRRPHATFDATADSIYSGNPGATDHETRELYPSRQLNKRAEVLFPQFEPPQFCCINRMRGSSNASTRLDEPMLALIGDPRRNSDVDLFREMWSVERFGLHEWKIRLLAHDGQHDFAERLRAKIDPFKAHDTPQAVVSTDSGSLRDFP